LLQRPQNNRWVHFFIRYFRFQSITNEKMNQKVIENLKTIIFIFS
jgi:hypothetical protein